MHKLILMLWLSSSVLLARAEVTIPKPADVLATMERVADWQVAHPYTKAPPTDWTNGAFYTGLVALMDISPSPRFHDAMMKIAEGNQWKPGPLPYHADDQCVGQAYLALYAQHHDPKMMTPLRERFDNILAHPRDISLDFDRAKNPSRTDRWSWCDALFMAPPAWTRMTALTGDPRYVDFMVREWKVSTDYLYDKGEHLYFRDSTFFDKREANGKKVFWARGNGWSIAGITRVLDFLPKDHPARAGFEQQFRDMAEKVRSLQQPDGYWRVSLLDPASYPAVETSGTGFFTYTLAWGVSHGLLDRTTYLPAVLRGWTALNQCIDADGKLTHVQIVAGSPKPFPPESTMPYGVGAFLLAGREMYRLGN
jgi:unsaturated rhamnogalacturonyl hydrolase